MSRISKWTNSIGVRADFKRIVIISSGQIEKQTLLPFSKFYYRERLLNIISPQKIPTFKRTGKRKTNRDGVKI